MKEVVAYQKDLTASSSVEGEIERAVEAVTLPGKPHFVAYVTDELQLVGEEGSIARVLSC